jgi:hypothetical protein
MLRNSLVSKPNTASSDVPDEKRDISNARPFKWTELGHFAYAANSEYADRNDLISNYRQYFGCFFSGQRKKLGRRICPVRPEILFQN